jgi:hypothetical protein
MQFKVGLTLGHGIPGNLQVIVIVFFENLSVNHPGAELKVIGYLHHD